MAPRPKQRTSTLRLIVWAVLLFALGLGLGTWFTSQGRRSPRLPGEEEPAPARPRPGAKPAPPPAPVPPAPAPAKPAPAPARPTAPMPAGPTASAAGLPRIALVIDDLGYAAPELVTRLCAQSVPFDVAVLPYLEFTRQSAEIAHASGKEVMLHLPMEPIGYPGPGKDPGVDAVLFDLTEAQVRDRVRKALANVPFRQGVNNHMGSRITPDQARMTWVLEEIKAKRCFFVDSRTEKNSVAFEVAGLLGIPTVQRKVFLDDDRDPAAIARQWQRALALARTDGHTLVIGHIYPETVAALEQLIPAAQGQVTFVPASALAR